MARQNPYLSDDPRRKAWEEGRKLGQAEQGVAQVNNEGRAAASALKEIEYHLILFMQEHLGSTKWVFTREDNEALTAAIAHAEGEIETARVESASKLMCARDELAKASSILADISMGDNR